MTCWLVVKPVILVELLMGGKDDPDSVISTATARIFVKIYEKPPTLTLTEGGDLPSRSKWLKVQDIRWGRR